MNKLLYIALSIGLSSQLLSATSLPLTSGKAIDGAVKQQEKKYYNITVPKNKSVRVNVTELEADVDLYVKKGNEVRVRFNDCYSSNSNTENEECVVTNEGETSTYTIMVNGFKASSFNLKATVDGAEEIPTLSSDPIADAVAQKEGKQYRVEGKKGETITVTLSDLTADADLRVRVGRKASLHSFNCKSNNGGKKTEECVITPKKDATVYVHVYGYQAANYNLKAVKGSTDTNPCITLEDLKLKIKKNEDVTKVNTSCITDMSRLFQENRHFNQDISKWDVSHVTNMSYLFASLTKFNQDISKWDVSNVTDMRAMFDEALSFNQDISNWDVSKVTNMSVMFRNDRLFNPDISKWNVSHVTNMYGMFQSALLFNKDISNWDVSNVTNMDEMFSRSFNQPIGKWDVSHVTSMRTMFGGAHKFNQDISNWDVSNVTDMTRMFKDAKLFNQDISNWDVSNVTDMTRMFKDAKLFNQDISNWNVSNVQGMSYMFYDALSFNQDISNWDVSNVQSMSYMFAKSNNNAESKFQNHDLSKWNIKKGIAYESFFNYPHNNIEPNWDDSDPLEVKMAKEHCLNKDNSTDHIMCLKGMVYILKKENGKNEIYGVLDFKNEYMTRGTVDDHGNSYQTLSLNKLENTNLFYTTSNDSKNLFIDFYNSYNMSLRHKLDTILIPINNFIEIKTYDNGQKMFIKYYNPKTGNDTTDNYDISNYWLISKIAN